MTKQRRDSAQLDLPSPMDCEALSTFLNRYVAIEDEMDRLREETRLLKEEYVDDLPLRGVLAAVKIVRTRAKLANHPKEPMRPVHLACLEALVEQYLSGVQAALDQLTHEAAGITTTLEGKTGG